MDVCWIGMWRMPCRKMVPARAVLNSASPSTTHRSVRVKTHPWADHWTRASGSMTTVTITPSETSMAVPSTLAESVLASRKKAASSMPEDSASARPRADTRSSGSSRPGASMTAMPATASTRATTTTRSVRCLSSRGATSAT